MSMLSVYLTLQFIIFSSQIAFSVISNCDKGKYTGVIEKRDKEKNRIF